MLKIWGRRNSSNVRKVLWCAEEIGLAYESIEVGGSFGGTQAADYQAMNPNGLVPVIVDGDFVLWESHTILRYLVGRYGGAALLPQEPRRRAEVEQWMDDFVSTGTESLRSHPRDAEADEHRGHAQLAMQGEVAHVLAELAGGPGPGGDLQPFLAEVTLFHRRIHPGKLKLVPPFQVNTDTVSSRNRFACNANQCSIHHQLSNK